MTKIQMMRKSFVLLLMICAVSFASQAQQTYIVRLAQGPVPPAVQQRMISPLIPSEVISAKQDDAAMGQDQRAALDVLKRYAVVRVDSESDRNALLSSGAVEEAYPNRLIPLHQSAITDDSLSAQQYALRIIDAEGMWELSTGEGIRVGVLDTGIDWEHPDLINRLAVSGAEDVNDNGRFDPWLSTIEVDGVTGDLNGIDDDGNGYVDDVIGFDFVDQDVRNVGDDRERDPIPGDEQGHGTSVSGVVAAEANNRIGIAGLAYDARIVTMRAFDATGNAEEDDIAAALVYAALNGVRVVNMSFGDGVDSPALRDAIKFASTMGCFLVASAGNSGTTSRQFPAGYDEVVAVGSTNDEDVRSPFSSTGSLVDLTAPGQGIVTTAVSGGYRTVNGTSFAAPYVAATAAALLSIKDELPPEEIRSIIAETSVDLGVRGWDPQYGTGRLQASNAMKMVGSALVGITFPRNEQEVDLRTSIDLDVFGSTQASAFERYEVYVGGGVEPTAWVLAGGADASVLRGRLATISSAQLVQGMNNVRLVVYLKNGRTIESRKRVRVLTNDTLRFTSGEVVSAYRDDRKVAVVTTTTNRPTTCTVIAEVTGGRRDTIVDIKRLSATHSVVVDPAPFGTSGNISVVCTAGNGERVQWDAPFDIGTDALPTTGWTFAGTGPFAGYVLDDVRDLYDDGTEVFPMADLSSGGFGPMLTVQREGLNWGFRDTTTDVWIPRGIGDANGNGRPEILGHVVGRATLFEAASKGGNPFETIVFDLADGRNNGAGMADIDGDGLEEVLTLSDSGCSVYSYKSGRFVKLGIAENNTPPAPGNIGNRVDEISVAVGDFDDDGRIEIAFGDTDGDLIISEYNGSSFATEFEFLGDGVGGSGYIATGDVNNDGIPEVIHGVPDDPSPGANGEYGRQVWTYRLFTTIGPDTYISAWTERFHGVRYGIGYRNGVSLANADDRPGDEIILCLFPRLYVFTWEETKARPLLYRPDVVSPRFLTHDFNGNGRTELGFGVTSTGLGLMASFSFIEYRPEDDRLATPAGLRARVDSDTSAFLSWSPVEGATEYRIYALVGNGGVFRATDTVTSTSVRIDTLSALQDLEVYLFRVSAAAPSSSLDESRRSDPVAVTLRQERTRVVSVQQPISRGAALAGANMLVRFSNNMKESGTPASAFKILDDEGRVLSMGKSVLLAGDSTLLVGFTSIDREALPMPELTMSISEIRDAVDMPIRAEDVTFQLKDTEVQEEIYLSSIDVQDPTRAILRFSEAVADDALDPR